MGGKGGSSTRAVFDYHLSIDYGICMGQVDHINKLWIKDKSIFCGLYYTRTDVDVHLPELFGGDDAEGGVSGTVEVYVGSDVQISSWELANRWAMTPYDAPGYRGLAHMFFRGLRDSDIIIEEAESEDIYQWDIALQPLYDSVGDIPSDPNAIKSGWKWTANNPYLPEAKVSVTRLPKIGIADQYAAIWPAARIDENGDLVGLASVEQVADTTDDEPDDTVDGTFDKWASTNIGAATVIDLIDMGYTQAQIDDGEVKIEADWSQTFSSYSTTSTTDTTMTTEVEFFDSPYGVFGDGSDIAPVSGEESLVSTSTSVPLSAGEKERGDVYPSTGAGSTSLGPVTAPVGSRYVHVRAYFTLGTDVFAQTPAESGNYHDEWLYDNPNAGYAPGSYGEGSIYVYDVDNPDPDPDPEEDDTAVAPPNTEFRPVFKSQMLVQTTPPTKRGIVVDLLSLGITQEEIDAGLVVVNNVYWRGVSYQSVPALPDGNSGTSIAVSWHDAFPENWYDDPVTDPLGQDNSEGPVFGAEHNMSLGALIVPPNTTHVQFRASYTGAVGQTTDVTDSNCEIGYYSYGPQHCATDDLIGPLPDANPARMIYDCLTNAEWGKGEDPALIDDDSFNACAATLYGERFGLSMGFFEQASIETFIGEILDHIQAFLYQDPATGLWTLRLLRDDYDAETLDTLDETNCVATDMKRRAWGETINEIVVSYMDPNTEKAATVAAQDMGNIAIQGGVISETREYYGIRNALLATVVANRDVRSAGYPLFSCNIEVDRREWAARPGDVRKFSWTEDGIEEIVVRVMSVDYGKPGDRKIRLNVTEDIFSIQRASYGSPQTTGWVNVNSAPSPIDAQIAFTVPLPSMVRAGGVIEDIDDDYPNVAAAILADEDGSPPDTIEIHTTVTLTNGDTDVEKIGEIPRTDSGVLMNAMAQEAESTWGKVQVNAIRRSAKAGDLFMIGFNEAISEIVMLDSYDSDAKTWTVARGMWDTVPLAWPVGVRVFNYPGNASSTDGRVRTSGETVTYNLLPRTSLGVLDFDDSTALTATYTDRPFAPFRPSDCQIEGQGFGDYVDTGAGAPSDFDVSWKNRNRTTEDVVALRWTEDSAALEAGQTVTLRILDDLGNFHDEITGLTGETQNILASQCPPGLEGYIEFLSERDGYVSVFGARRRFDIRPETGYGYAYGIDYGGSLV